jgi:hypothetical protein
VTAGLALSGIFELAPIRDTYLDAKWFIRQVTGYDGGFS